MSIILAFLLLYFIIIFLVSLYSLKGIPSFKKVRGEGINGPLVSIILPAKNEADTIGLALDSLTKLEYSNKEIIVVLGDSSDGTEQIVRKYNVKVVEEGKRQEGWTGKNWACHLGYLASRGDVLLFTDGDVVHKKESLSVALSYKQRNKIDLLSCWPRIITRSFAEGSILPVGYFLLSLGISTVASQRTEHGRLIKGANGQYILIDRKSYEEVGGHRSVKNEILEDAAIGSNALKKGLKVVNASGREILEVYPYSDLNEIREAFERFGAAIFKSKKAIIGVFMLHLIYFILPIVLTALSLFTRSLGYFLLSALSLAIVLLTCILFYSQNSKLRYFPTFPVSSILACIFYLSGYSKYRDGGIKWKGTAYKHDWENYYISRDKSQSI